MTTKDSSLVTWREEQRSKSDSQREEKPRAIRQDNGTEALGGWAEDCGASDQSGPGGGGLHLNFDFRNALERPSNGTWFASYSESFFKVQFPGP